MGVEREVGGKDADLLGGVADVGTQLADRLVELQPRGNCDQGEPGLVRKEQGVQTWFFSRTRLLISDEALLATFSI